MAGRGMRARAPVSYSDKSSGMVPAWLKTIQPNVNDPPAESKRKKKPAQSKKKEEAGSPDKENASDSGKRPTAKTSGASKKSSGSGNGKQTSKKKSDPSKKETKRVPARGRNAGLTVVPIGAFVVDFGTGWSNFLNLALCVLDDHFHHLYI